MPNYPFAGEWRNLRANEWRALPDMAQPVPDAPPPEPLNQDNPADLGVQCVDGFWRNPFDAYLCHGGEWIAKDPSYPPPGGMGAPIEPPRSIELRGMHGAYFIKTAMGYEAAYRPIAIRERPNLGFEPQEFEGAAEAVAQAVPNNAPAPVPVYVPADPALPVWYDQAQAVPENAGWRNGPAVIRQRNDPLQRARDRAIRDLIANIEPPQEPYHRWEEITDLNTMARKGDVIAGAGVDPEDVLRRRFDSAVSFFRGFTAGYVIKERLEGKPFLEIQTRHQSPFQDGLKQGSIWRRVRTERKVPMNPIHAKPHPFFSRDNEP